MSLAGAEQVARRKVVEEGLDPSEYRCAALCVDAGWAFHFEHVHAPEMRGWPGHFTVLVKTDGSADLLKGR
jgi:hypothetical protein